MPVTPATYRYAVEKNGRVHCRADSLGELCAACRAKAEACTCEKCQREHSSGVPAPPSLAAAIRASRGLPAAQPEAHEQLTGVPPPPSMAEIINQQRRRQS
jgi:hypothetical protein